MSDNKENQELKKFLSYLDNKQEKTESKIKELEDKIKELSDRISKVENVTSPFIMMK